MQIFFAEEWPTKLWMAGFIGAGVVTAFDILLPTFLTLDSLWMYGLFALSLVIIGAISYLVSIIAGGIMLPPIFNLRAKLNGAPFAVGDQVEILKQPRRGTLTSIYEVWTDRFEARLDLGPSAKEDYSDVYSLTAFRKATNT